MGAHKGIYHAPDGTEWLTAGAAAKRMGVSSRTVSRWAKEGRFPNARYTLGGQVRIPVSDVTSLLAEMAFTPDGAR